jgi:hypothetical protein
VLNKHSIGYGEETRVDDVLLRYRIVVQNDVSSGGLTSVLYTCSKQTLESVVLLLFYPKNNYHTGGQPWKSRLETGLPVQFHCLTQLKILFKWAW